MKDAVLLEAKRLHGLGFAILVLHPKNKRPKGNGWTSGPRLTWEQILEIYKPGDNIGVRTGKPSEIEGSYLACIDVDVKNPAYGSRAKEILRELIGNVNCPEVISGSGGLSRHFYCLTTNHFKMLTIDKCDDGEICVYSDGRQMVLPPSIHPNGKPYVWKRGINSSLEDIPLIEFVLPEPGGAKEVVANRPGKEMALNFTVTPVELEWLPISKTLQTAMIKGTGVSDGSAFLLTATAALISADLTQDEILSVLTDPNYFVSTIARRRRGLGRDSQAQWLWEYTVKKMLDERKPTGFSKASEVKERKLTKEEQEKQTKEIEADRDWKQDLKRTGQNGMGPPAGLVDNVYKILINGVGPLVIQRNEFARRDHYGMKTPWGGIVGELYKDEETIKIKHWLSQNFSFEPKSTVIEEAVILIANKNSYDPVKDYLSLLAWDGQPRLASWLKINFNAKGDDDYLGQVFTKWVLAMVARAYQPGLKFDWMPIFEGAQGVGKSSFGRLLVGEKYFLDSLPNFTDKDAALGLQGIWSVEMGELANMRRAQLEDVKAFLTRTIDKVRAPYGRRWEESPRRCVFFGTTNRQTYLMDDTGNRRFKPVEVGGLNFKALKRDRDQLFAEAKYLYETHGINEVTFELSGQAKLFEANIHQEKMVEDDSSVMKEALKEHFEKGNSNIDFNRFRILDLFSGVGPLQNWKADNRNFQFAAKMLKSFGGQKTKIQGFYYWKIENRAGFSKKPAPENEIDFY